MTTYASYKKKGLGELRQEGGTKWASIFAINVKENNSCDERRIVGTDLARYHVHDYIVVMEQLMAVIPNMASLPTTPRSS